jgi:hypothetical protein
MSNKRKRVATAESEPSPIDDDEITEIEPSVAQSSQEPGEDNDTPVKMIPLTTGEGNHNVAKLASFTMSPVHGLSVLDAHW